MTIAQAVTTDDASADNVAKNLLVLLQSLDSNGNPEDGISFTSEIRSAVGVSAVDLTAAEGTFTTSLTNLVAAVSAAAPEATLEQVDRTEAVAHFQGQGPGSLAGVYVRADANFAPITQKAVTLTIFRSGAYLLGGQHDQPLCNLANGDTAVNSMAFSDANGNGIEFGRYTWDPLTNAFAVSQIMRETDGYCGFNEPVTGATNDTTILEMTDKGLVFKEADGTVAYRFVRLQREALTLAGAWVGPTALMQGIPFTLTFFPSTEDGLAGRYLQVESAPLNVEEDASPGIEEGCYSVDANDNLTVSLDAATCAGAIDTNNTAGVSNHLTGTHLFIDENDRLVFDEGDGDITGMTRLPAPAITHEALAGAWIAQFEPDVELADQEQLFMLTMFEDGTYLLGGQEDDASCVPGDYPTGNLESDGNGPEYGELSLAERPGLVVPRNVIVDTNGECGLFHNGKTGPNGQPFQQAYFFAPNAAGDALVLWANDEPDPAGLVFKRVPSVSTEIWGAWRWSRTGAAAHQFAVSTYLQFPGGSRDGVMFEVSTLPDESDENVGVGILREAFDWDSPDMSSYRSTYEFCVDTESGEDSCESGDDPLEEQYVVNGDIITDDEDSEASMRRIASGSTED